MSVKAPPGVIINTRYGRFNVANTAETKLFLATFGNRFTTRWVSDISELSAALTGDLIEAADALARFNKRWAGIMLPEQVAA